MNEHLKSILVIKALFSKHSVKVVLILIPSADGVSRLFTLHCGESHVRPVWEILTNIVPRYWLCTCSWGVTIFYTWPATHWTELGVESYNWSTDNGTDGTLTPSVPLWSVDTTHSIQTFAWNISLIVFLPALIMSLSITHLVFRNPPNGN